MFSYEQIEKIVKNISFKLELNKQFNLDRAKGFEMENNSCHVNKYSELYIINNGIKKFVTKIISDTLNTFSLNNLKKNGIFSLFKANCKVIKYNDNNIFLMSSSIQSFLDDIKIKRLITKKYKKLKGNKDKNPEVIYNNRCSEIKEIFDSALYKYIKENYKVNERLNRIKKYDLGNYLLLFNFYEGPLTRC